MSPFGGYEYGRTFEPNPQHLWRITTPTGKTFEVTTSEWCARTYWDTPAARMQGFKLERIDANGTVNG